MGNQHIHKQIITESKNDPKTKHSETKKGKQTKRKTDQN